MDSQKIRQIVKRAASVSGKAALWAGAAVAGLWILGEAGKQAEEEEAQRPPVIAQFNGSEDTYTATFTTYALGKYLGWVTLMWRYGYRSLTRPHSNIAGRAVSMDRRSFPTGGRST
jgi:hypothetical protein